AVQGVPVAGPIAQQQRRRSLLPGAVARVEPVAEGVGPRGRAAQALVPGAGDAEQVRPAGGAQRRDRRGQWVVEVAVLAAAEPMSGHVDGGPEAGVVVV